MSEQQQILQVNIPEAFDFLFTPSRYKGAKGGRGSGKSQNFAQALLVQGYQKRHGILCARELQVSIADSVHSLLDQLINADKTFSRFYKITNKEIRGINGTFFIFKGLKHNIAEIKSLQGITRCWVEEAEAVSNKSWETLIPTIREPGSEIWATWNPKNPTDPTHTRFVAEQDDDMIVRDVNYLDNPYFPDVLEKERLKLFKNDPEAYEHVWLGKFDTRYSGSVYAKYIKQEQIKDIAYDAQRPIYTAWDLGYDDATSIVFYQLARNEIQVIDYYESNFEDIQHYCEVLYGARIVIDTRSPETGKVLKWHFGERMDEQRSGYNYMGGTHYVPHDAAYKLQAAQGRSIVEQAAEFGISLHVIQATNQQNSEAALRKTLPMCWFNRDTTKDLVHALMSYHYEYDEDKRIYKQKPIHDWSSHAADCCELMARMWTDGGRAMLDIARDAHDNRVHGLRRKYASQLGESTDPYRMQKHKVKK